MSFSPGGTGPAITVADPTGKHALALSWPTALPAPRVSGNAAVYADVLPGVDLRLAASGDAYTEVLIVHDAQAAANPALASLTMHVHGTGLTLKAGPDGTLSATDASGHPVMSAPQSIMWDSRADSRAGPAPTADDPGSGVVTPLSVSVAPSAAPKAAAGTVGGASADDAELTVAAPAAALTGKGVVFPLYLDPGAQLGQLNWDEVDNQGHFWWDDSTLDVRVGYCDDPTCPSPNPTMRSYFEMDTNYLAKGNGTHATVLGANFYITQTWNAPFNCVAEPVDLWSAGPIGSGNTSWPGEAINNLASVSSGAGHDCPSASLNFNSPGLTSFMQQAANDWWPNTTFGLVADNESDPMQWKRFDNSSPALSVTYDYPPNTPGGLRVSDQIDCAGTIYTPDAQPTMYATATDNNPQPQNVNYWFEMWPAGGSSRDSWNTSPVTRASGQEGGWQENMTSDMGVGNDQFQVRDDNGPLSSGWSPFFNFHTVHEDLSGVHPTVFSYDFPQDAAGNALWGAPQGLGRFEIGNGGNANVAGFQYSYDNNAFPAPPTCGNGVAGSTSGAVGATGGSGTGGAILPTPPGGALAFGHHTLYVRGYDVVGNPTGVTAYQFLLSQSGASATAHLPVTSSLSNAALGKCLDDPNNKGAAGDIAQIWDCNNALAQEWSLNSNGTVTHNGLCLDVIGGPSATANGTKVQLYTCNGWANQQWQVAQDSTGNWILRNPNSGRCLDDSLGSKTDGQQFQIWDCNNTDHQTWGFDLNPYRYGGADALTAGGVTATGTRSGSSLSAQNQICDAGGKGCFSGGQQLWWYGAGPGGGSYVTVPFTVAGEADYALSARLTSAPDYGQYEFAVDGTPLDPTVVGLAQAVDQNGKPYGRYDAYRAAGCCGINDVSLGGLHLTGGRHTLTITIVGTSGAAGAYGLGLDYFSAAQYANATAASFSASLNNHGITDDAAPATGDLDFGPAAPGDVGGVGAGDSLSKQTLAAANLAPGTAFTLDGINFTMPTANGAGNDNTVATGQTITLDPSQQIRANAIGLLVAGTNGGTAQTTATVNYAGGQAAEAPDVPKFPSVGDWCSGPAASAAYTLAYRNDPHGKDTSGTCNSPKLYLVVLPVHPMNNLASITLPYVGSGFTPGAASAALHVLAIGVRPAAAANLTKSADASAGNHPLTMSGNVGFDGYAKGKQGAAVFDGAGGSAATSGPVLDTTKSFSVSAWANLQQLGSANQTFAVQQGSTASGFSLDYVGSSGHWQFGRPNADTMNSSHVQAVSNAAATTGWHHLVGTWDATSGTMRLYVDGVAQNSTATDTTPFAANGPLVIGRGYWNGTPTNFVNGEVTDVQAYQRVLSPADVGALYSGPVTNDLTGSTGPATGWWQLQDFGRNWTGAWAAEPTAAAPSTTKPLAGMTIRQIVHPSDLGFGQVQTLVNGTPGTEAPVPVQTRIRLTNRFSTTPVTIDAASIAAQTGTAGTVGGAATGAATALTFDGKASVTIDPGAEAVSDAVRLPDTSTGTGNLAVSLTLAAGTGTPPAAAQLTDPAYPVYVASGNQSADTGTAGTWSTDPSLTGRYWLSGVDVTDVNDPNVAQTAGSQPGTIAVLGDQVSGAGSPATWVDALGKDPNAVSLPSPNPGGFVNLSSAGATTASAVARFGAAPNATVLDEPNLRAVVVTLGINDLTSGECATASSACAATVEQNLQKLVSTLTPYGIENYSGPDGTAPVHVYLATVPDQASLTPTQEAQRTKLNTCIKGGACDYTGLIGNTGYVDLDAAVTAAGPGASRAAINSAITAKFDANASLINTW
ncbi:hypothetical protein GCM10009738_11110 [Kitasatospora viridis]